MVFVIFILFGESRGAFLGLLVCGMLLFLRAPGGQKIKMVITAVILIVVLLLFLSAFAPQGFFEGYKHRLATMLGEEDINTGEVEYEASAAGRLAMWKGAIEIYKNHPEYWLLGVGMYNYAGMYINHMDEIANVLNPLELEMIYYGGGGGKELHNTYLSLLMGGGAVVLGTWMLLILCSWLQSHEIPRKYPQIIDGVNIHNYAKAVEIGIVGYCVCMLFLNMDFVDFFYWHLTMPGVIANLGKAQLKKEALDLEDEEFDEEFMERLARRRVYAPYA